MTKIIKVAFTSKQEFVHTLFCCQPTHHIHQFSELIYILDGSIKVIVGDRREVAHRGDIAIISPFCPHAYFTEEGNTVHMWMLLFSGSLVGDRVQDQAIYREYTSSIFTPSKTLKDYLEERMLTTNETPVILDEKGIRHLRAILYPILDEYSSTVPTVSEKRTPDIVKTTVIVKMLAYLSKNFTKNITIKDASKALGYSESHLSHAISNELSTNFRHLLNSFRIDHAKNLLASKNTSIYAISTECGFLSERSFHRAFHSATGITPTEYKQRCKNV